MPSHSRTDEWLDRLTAEARAVGYSGDALRELLLAWFLAHRGAPGSLSQIEDGGFCT